MTAALDPGRSFTGSERELLENTLESNRTELVRAVEHLSGIQARAKLVPSLTTPISLIKHCAAAERIWFQRTPGGMSIEACDGHATGGDGSFHVADDETLADVITEYMTACRRSNELAATHHLDDTVEHHLVGTVNLRFIYLGHDRRSCPPRRPRRHPRRTDPGNSSDRAFGLTRPAVSLLTKRIHQVLPRLIRAVMFRIPS